MSTFDQNLNVSLEHFMIQGTSSCISLSPDCQYAVIAAKKGLYLVDLEQPFNRNYRFLRHVSKWEVADVQWNPHLARKEWIASTSNQNVLVWNVDDLSGSIKSNPVAQLATEDTSWHRVDSQPSKVNQPIPDSLNSSKCVQFILHCHSRAVSDINWSPFEPEWIATCSYDSYLHIWDLKASTTKPVTSVSAWTAGATQVKWNKMNEWLLASSHDSDLRIWDIRKGTTPLSIMTAHTHKIYGIDWSWAREDFILTCGQDKSVKFWDVNQPRICQGMIMTTSPIWRARFTPFGEGIVTMPQRTEHHLQLWNYTENTSSPVYTFAGHTDVPRDFLWRIKHVEGTTKYQMITWAKDQHLRFWPATEEMLKAVGTVSKRSNLSIISPKPLNPSKKHGGLLWDLQHHPVSSPDSIPDSRLIKLNKTPPAMEHEFILGSRWNSRDLTMPSLSCDNIPNESLLEGRQPSKWQEDIISLAKQYPLFQVEKIHSNTASVSLQNENESVDAPHSFIRLDIHFPANYPSEPPAFVIPKNSMLSMTQRSVLVKRLSSLASETPISGSHSWDLFDSTAKNVFLKRDESEEALDLADNSSHQSLDVAEDETDISSSSTDSMRTQVRRVLVANEKYTPEGLSKKKNKFVAGGNQFVPFPRLCGAQFSTTGQLVYFFSPMPHPLITKFADQETFYGKYYSMQPRTLREYAKYTSFLEQRENRLDLAASLADRHVSTVEKATKSGRSVAVSRARFNSWMEEDDDSEEERKAMTGAIPSVFWRPSPEEKSDMPALMSNFLQRLSSRRRTSPTTPTAQLSLILPDPTSTTEPTARESATYSELSKDSLTAQDNVPHSFKHSLQRKVMDKDKSLPSIVLGTPPWRIAGSMMTETQLEAVSVPTSLREMLTPPMIVTPKQERILDFSSSCSPMKRNELSQDCGAVVHIRCVKKMLPVSLDLAYGPFQLSPLDQCRHNEKVARDHGSDQVARIWQLLTLLIQVESTSTSTVPTRGICPKLPLRYHMRQKENTVVGISIVRYMLQWCEKQGDIQTIALMGCILYQLYHQYAIEHSLNVPLSSRMLTQVPCVPHPPLLLDLAWIPYIDRCIQEYADMLSTPRDMLISRWLYKCLWHPVQHESYDVNVRYCPVCRCPLRQSMITQCLGCMSYGHLKCFTCLCK